MCEIFGFSIFYICKIHKLLSLYLPDFQQWLRKNVMTQDIAVYIIHSC